MARLVDFYNNIVQEYAMRSISFEEESFQANE